MILNTILVIGLVMGKPAPQKRSAGNEAPVESKVAAELSNLDARVIAARNGTWNPIGTGVLDVAPDKVREANQTILREYMRYRRQGQLETLLALTRTGRGHDALLPALVGLGPTAIPGLRAILKDHGSDGVARLVAARALDLLSDTQAVGLIEDALAGAQAPTNASLPLIALRELYVDLRVRGLRDEQQVEQLVATLIEDRSHVAKIARERLIQLGWPAVEPLLQVVADDRVDLVARLDAIWSLGWIGDARATAVLARLAEKTTAERPLRLAAIAGLGRCGDVSALSVLQRLLSEPEEAGWNGNKFTSIRLQAEEAISAIESGNRPVRVRQR